MNARCEVRKSSARNGRHSNGGGRVVRPAVDIFETSDAITLRANLPGVAEEGLSVEVDGRILTIQGDINLDMPDGMESLHAEIRSDRYRRAFTLSDELDAEQITASLKDGLLSLTVPKREEVKPRKIEINVG